MNTATVRGSDLGRANGALHRIDPNCDRQAADTTLAAAKAAGIDVGTFYMLHGVAGPHFQNEQDCKRAWLAADTAGIPRDRILQLAASGAVPLKPAKPTQAVFRDLKAAIRHLPADDYDVWINAGHALKGLGENGRRLWFAWSATSPRFDEAESAAKWDSFAPSRTGYGAVFAEAQRRGWENPAGNVVGSALGDFGDLTAGQHQPRTDSAPISLSDRLAALEHCMVALDATENPFAALAHVVAQLVPTNEVTLLAGHGGAGKSYVALLIAVLVALDRPFGALPTGDEQ